MVARIGVCGARGVDKGARGGLVAGAGDPGDEARAFNLELCGNRVAFGGEVVWERSS